MNFLKDEKITFFTSNYTNITCLVFSIGFALVYIPPTANTHKVKKIICVALGFQNRGNQVRIELINIERMIKYASNQSKSNRFARLHSLINLKVCCSSLTYLKVCCWLCILNWWWSFVLLNFVIIWCVYLILWCCCGFA